MDIIQGCLVLQRANMLQLLDFGGATLLMNTGGSEIFDR